MKNYWGNDKIQFARLLAELRSIGLTDKQMQYLTSPDGMDLEPEEVEELLERAEIAWQKHKANML